MTRIPLILSLLALLPASAIAQNTWYVPDDFPTIQAGIDGSVNGDTMIVRDGTYFENINFNGKAITLKSENGPATTTIDGNQAGSVVRIESGEGSDSVFEGFTVLNGTGTITTTITRGGGFYCYDSSPTINNCTFIGNTADYGGGMFCFLSSPTLNDCVFVENNGKTGAGMYCHTGSSPILNTCTFEKNTAGSQSVIGAGGGMSISSGNSSPILNNCTFRENRALGRGFGRGGAISAAVLNAPKLNNCVFTDNTAELGGGAIYLYDSTMMITNCTFVNNAATDSSAGKGGGLYSYTANPTVTNTIFWNNFATTGPEVHKQYGSWLIAYCDIKGITSGTGNIDSDPLFVDSANEDFHLQSSSPCIDAGNPNADLDPDGTRADMGAIYYDQGSGSSPTLSVNNLIAGHQVLVEITNATPSNNCHFAWSLRGGGPTPTPWGDALVSRPYTLKMLSTDSTGYASYTANIPPAAAGITVWFHGTDVGTQSMLNALMLVIQ